MTLREQLLSSPAKPAGEFVLPELGGVVVHLRRWTLEDWINLSAVTKADEDNPRLRTARMVLLCVCDESGRAVFRDAHEAAKVFTPDSAARVIDAAMKANGLSGDEDPKKA